LFCFFVVLVISHFIFDTTHPTLASPPRVVVASLHQLRPHSFSLIDNLIVLARGRIVFAGPRAECVP
jgi:ABC-type Na+ transport system ATPase subunit NatA